jgi:RNA recognition motif-containing protein
MESKEVASPIKIKVSNLTRNVTTKHVEEIFGKYGAIKSVSMPIDDKSKKQLGYALIEYTNKDETTKAISGMNGGQLDSMVIKVELLALPVEHTHKKHKKARRSRDRHSSSKSYSHSKSRSRSRSPKH